MAKLNVFYGVINEVFKFRYLSVGISALILIYPSLLTTSKKDFVFILFNLLYRPGDKESTNVVLDLLITSRPQWSTYKDHYIDLKNKLPQWSNEETKFAISTRFPELKSSTSNEEETKYWNELEAMKSPES